MSSSKGTSRPVFIGVYRLEVHLAMLLFSTQLCELLPLSPYLWFNSPPPIPFPMWISVRGGGYGVLGLGQINIGRKVSLHVNLFRWRHFALTSMSLIFLRIPTSVNLKHSAVSFLRNLDGTLVLYILSNMDRKSHVSTLQIFLLWDEYSDLK